MAATTGENGRCHVLLCCTGSVASMKVPELVHMLLTSRPEAAVSAEVRVVSTDHARHFFSPADLPEGVPHYTDADEWLAWRERGDPVQHIALRDWADLLLIAPLDANSLAKISCGLADNLVACVARAWPVGMSPVVVAPAMNTGMWDHPVTAPQIEILQSWGYTVVPPVEKTLICGETGVGAMAALSDIVDVVLSKCYSAVVIGTETH